MQRFNDSIEITTCQKNVLVVEDDTDVLLFIKESIAGDKYQIITALTGEDALSQIANAARRRIDLVILDHRLPDKSGLEVLKKIKKLTFSIPVMYMTAYGNEDIAIQAFRYGACDYIKKPFNSFDLISRIDFFSGKKSAISGGEMVMFQESSAGDYFYQRTGAASSGPHSYRMQKALVYINENYSTKIRLKKVAQIACMSEYYFSRIFKREVGITYQDYLNKCRIDRAKHYLKNKGLTITEIAFAVGYDDLSNFIYIFQKVTGLTPSQFASQCR